MKLNSELVTYSNTIGDVISGLGIGIKESGGDPDELLPEIKPGALFLKELGTLITDYLLVEVFYDTKRIRTDWKTPIRQLMEGHFFNGMNVRKSHCIAFDKATEEALNHQNPLLPAKYRIFKLKNAMTRAQWQNFLHARGLSFVGCRELFALAAALPTLLSGIPSLISPVCDINGHRAEVRDTSADTPSVKTPIHLTMDKLDIIFSESFVVAALPRHGK